MNQKVFVYLMIIFLVPALACGLASRENESGARQVSLQAGPTPVPSPTSLPVVEDIEIVGEETPEMALADSTNITDTIITDTIVSTSKEEASLALPSPDEDDDEEEGEGEEAKTETNDIVALSTATATPTPIPTNTPTSTPSPTPSPIAVSSGWPPVLPDATDLESGDGYVRYITGTDVGAVADFYRREMGRYGWAEMDEPGLAAALGLEDFSSLIQMPDGGTLIIYSKDGGETLSFVMIAESGGQVGVALVWID